MKVTAIIGSPRSKGNSATIVKLLIDALQPGKPQTMVVELNKLTYRGCQACMACKTTSETCVVMDDLTDVLEQIRVSDVVIIAAPVYIGDVTAQAKGLIDRLYSLYKPDYRTNPNPGRLAPNKKLVLVVPQGNPDEKMFADIVSRYCGMFKRQGFSTIYPIRALGVGPQSDVEKNAGITALVASTATDILAS